MVSENLETKFTTKSILLNWFLKIQKPKLLQIQKPDLLKGQKLDFLKHQTSESHAFSIVQKVIRGTFSIWGKFNAWQKLGTWGKV